uniref:Uncharacterized protein n=1 Tax=Equus caballus TaxID=9796 RepID=A0A3Q2LID8_HORSE
GSRLAPCSLRALLSLSRRPAYSEGSGLLTSPSREWKAKFPELLCVWVPST